MAHAQHSHWVLHDWLESHPQLMAGLGKHAIALSVAAFVLMVAVLLGLFEWAQILPEQISATVDSSNRTMLSQSESSYTTASFARDQFIEQKKTAAVTELPDQF